MNACVDDLRFAVNEHQRVGCAVRTAKVRQKMQHPLTLHWCAQRTLQNCFQKSLNMATKCSGATNFLVPKFHLGMLSLTICVRIERNVSVLC